MRSRCPRTRAKAGGARARCERRSGWTRPWHVYPEQAAAGLWTTPTDLAKFAIEVQQTLARPIDASAVAGDGAGDGDAGRRRSVRGRLHASRKKARAGTSSHGGSNWGFRCDLIAHRSKGYGAVIMTNGDNGGRLMAALREKIARGSAWDMYDKPLTR